FAAHPAMQPTGVPRYPLAVKLGNGPAISASWITAPCAPLTGDLPAAVRGDAVTLSGLVKLLDRNSYAGAKADRGLEPRGWAVARPAMASDDTSAGTLGDVLPRVSAITRGAWVQGLMRRDHRYTKAEAAEQALRRTLVWRNALLCDSDFVDADLGPLLDVPA